jgi:hypothetical protein
MSFPGSHCLFSTLNAGLKKLNNPDFDLKNTPQRIIELFESLNQRAKVRSDGVSG